MGPVYSENNLKERKDMMSNKKLEKLAKLNEKRSKTKKAAKAERNANREMWNGFRPVTMQLNKNKKKNEQKAKNELRYAIYA